MRVMHLTSSRFFGGPERQMLGLAESLRDKVTTIFASFSESNLNQTFLTEVADAGFTALSLKHDSPNLIAARREIQQHLRQHNVDVLACHGYKAGLIGWWAARNSKIPAIAVSRGWTNENWKVGLYETLDRFMLRRMEQVVCVSKAQADKVSKTGVDRSRISIIHNSISNQRFARHANGTETIDAFQNQLNAMFDIAAPTEITKIIGAAGRLSPEKGFDILVEAAAQVIGQRPEVGFVLFGEGPEKAELQRLIIENEIEDQFILAGFTDSLDQFMPNFDLFVQSSHTEGLPNVLLESLAAGVSVVATDVGGTNEVLDNGNYGTLVRPNDVADLSNAIVDNLGRDDQQDEKTETARRWVAEQFTFEKQAASYEALFTKLTGVPAQ